MNIHAYQTSQYLTSTQLMLTWDTVVITFAISESISVMRGDLFTSGKYCDGSSNSPRNNSRKYRNKIAPDSLLSLEERDTVTKTSNNN